MQIRSLLKASAIVLGVLSLSLPAVASTMPKADFQPGHNNLGLGIGQGLSASLDFPLNSKVSLGGSLGYLPGPLSSVFDVRGLYKFVPGGSHQVTIDGILGVVGYSAYPGLTYPFGLEVGVGLAYPFTSKFTGRLNLLVPYNGGFNQTYYEGTFFGPAGGIELGYHFNPRFEGTIGLNGLGNFLGLNYSF